MLHDQEGGVAHLEAEALDIDPAQVGHQLDDTRRVVAIFVAHLVQHFGDLGATMKGTTFLGRVEAASLALGRGQTAQALACRLIGLVAILKLVAQCFEFVGAGRALSDRMGVEPQAIRDLL